MKKQYYSATKKILLTSILLGMTAIPAIYAHAQSPENETGAVHPAASINLIQDQGVLERRVQKLELLERMRKENEARSRQAEQFEGSWLITATPVVPPGMTQPPPSRAYATIARGGAYFGSDRSRASSKQHGSWEHNGGG